MNPNISATLHRWAVALTPVIVGCGAVVIKATADQGWTATNNWLLVNAFVVNIITVYLNWVRSTTPD